MERHGAPTSRIGSVFTEARDRERGRANEAAQDGEVVYDTTHRRDCVNHLSTVTC